MENLVSKFVERKKSHKEWRKEVKKLRRKRVRQKLAKERDEKAKEEEIKKQNDPTYQVWVKEQETLELFKEEEEKLRHDDEEEQWMRRELLAQKKFHEEKQRWQQIEKAKEEKRRAIQREFEKQQEILKQRIEEKKRQAEENLRKHEVFMTRISEYIENGGDIPSELLERAETNPGKEPCLFFNKTGSCRFGDKCSRNHSRPGISRILLLPHFFNHIRLEQNKVTEYGNDLVLEFSDTELYRDYDTFFEDVIPELEKFGKIENFRTSQNYEAHLRGNVYVEYEKERDALRAFMKLQGRYYASKRINVEFCALTSWKTALCGLSLTKRCPKGRGCNFIHIFKNPKNKYNTPLVNEAFSERKQMSTENSKRNSGLSWNDGDVTVPNRNWRWSESPEVETSRNSRKGSRHRSQSSHRKKSRASSRSKNELSDSEHRKSREKHRHRKRKTKKHKHKHKDSKESHKSKKYEKSRKKD